MQTVILARNAMATRFELVLHGDDESSLRAAGEEALDEIDRLESRLSLYRPGSEIAQVNHRAAREPVHVTPEIFHLLQHAKKHSEETGGAFDITVAPLVRCWGFMGGSRPRQFSGREPTPSPSLEGSSATDAPRQFPSSEGSGVGWTTETGRVPSAEELVAARAVVGMKLVQLDERNLTVRFARDGVMLDLGAIGKGYAVERAASLLRESGITSALIHGGTSTVCAIGTPQKAGTWKVAVAIPESIRGRIRLNAANPSASVSQNIGGTPVDTVTVDLRDENLSVSAVWGRSFELEGEQFGHVIDPRSGHPVRDTVLAAVILPSATETDALSTALLTTGRTGLDRIFALRPGMRLLLLHREHGELRIESRGFGAKGNLPVEKQTFRS